MTVGGKGGDRSHDAEGMRKLGRRQLENSLDRSRNYGVTGVRASGGVRVTVTPGALNCVYHGASYQDRHTHGASYQTPTHRLSKREEWQRTVGGRRPSRYSITACRLREQASERERLRVGQRENKGERALAEERPARARAARGGGSVARHGPQVPPVRVRAYVLLDRM